MGKPTGFLDYAREPVHERPPLLRVLDWRGQWKEAWIRLAKTNNFPEFTGRVCPAPCEGSCTVAIDLPAVNIKMIEESIADRAFAEGWVEPQPPTVRTGKRIAVVGSGPAGLAAAAQLNRAGHEVTVFERSDRIGTAIRHGARSITQLEIMPRPPEMRDADNPWPQWPKVYRLDYGQDEAKVQWGGDH